MSDGHLELLREEIRKERRWHLKSISITDYHRIQCDKFENIRGKKWTLLDTSNDLKLSLGYVSESLKLSKAFSDGIIVSSMTREQALDVIRGKVKSA